MAAVTITATLCIPVASPTNNQVNYFKTGAALAAMTAGQVAYEDTSTNPPSYGLCDVDHATAANRVPVGIVVGPAVAAGQQVTVQVAGQLTVGGTLAKGLHYVPGATAGALHPSADQTTSWHICTLGMAISTTVIEFAIKSTNVQI